MLSVFVWLYNTLYPWDQGGQNLVVVASSNSYQGVVS